MKHNNKRLLSIDIVRGLTVAGMILVNNGYGESFEMLRHAKWNGLSVSDFVFPFFLFIMGVSLYLSLAKTGFAFNGKTFGKILKRSLILFLIGLSINFIDLVVWDNAVSLSELRFWAVLQRIALCYFLAGVFALCGRPKFTLPLVFILLVAYSVILAVGNGYSQEKEINILYQVDEWMVGASHLYHKSAVDPEGLLGTICALVNVLLGFYCGGKLLNTKGLSEKTVKILTTGTILVIIGFIVNFFLPYNKRIWSPSFALVTSGACALITGVIMKWVDMDKKRGKLADFFTVFGSNALLLYITSECLAIFFGKIGISEWLYSGIYSLIPVAKIASLIYALCYVLINFLIGYPLWKKHIYIKL